jgi:hypothetical protein
MRPYILPNELSPILNNLQQTILCDLRKALLPDLILEPIPQRGLRINV